MSLNNPFILKRFNKLSGFYASNVSLLAAVFVTAIMTLMATLLIGKPAYAQTVVNTQTKDTAGDLRYTVQNNTLVLSNGKSFKATGQAEFSYLFWDVYDSRLFNMKGKFDSKSDWHEQGPVVLEIHYKRDIKAKDLIDSTVEQWQHLKVSDADYAQYVTWLSETWPNLKEGDKLALLMYSDHSVFFYNNEFLSKQDNPEFGKTFLDIWLSVDTSEPKLRKQLLSL
ncbi:chalcone isomerase family protein [Psychrosphaera sp.]|nr:chalcone isomerase family protein [Psychrosphaera sp.]